MCAPNHVCLCISSTLESGQGGGLTFKQLSWDNQNLSAVPVKPSIHSAPLHLFPSRRPLTPFFCSCIVDLPLSVLLLRCFVTSPYTNHGAIWTNSEIERLRKAEELKEMRREEQIRYGYH